MSKKELPLVALFVQKKLQFYFKRLSTIITARKANFRFQQADFKNTKRKNAVIQNHKRQSHNPNPSLANHRNVRGIVAASSFKRKNPASIRRNEIRNPPTSFFECANAFKRTGLY